MLGGAKVLIGAGGWDANELVRQLVQVRYALYMIHWTHPTLAHCDRKCCAAVRWGHPRVQPEPPSEAEQMSMQ